MLPDSADPGGSGSTFVHPPVTLQAATSTSGAAPTLPNTPPPVPSVANGTILAGTGNTGQTITVPIGTVVRVDLAATNDGNMWTVPAAAQGKVLRQDQGRAFSSGEATATFRAIAMGQTYITAGDQCARPGCTGSTLLWMVNVTVVAA